MTHCLADNLPVHANAEMFPVIARARAHSMYDALKNLSRRWADVCECFDAGEKEKVVDTALEQICDVLTILTALVEKGRE